MAIRRSRCISNGRQLLKFPLLVIQQRLGCPNFPQKFPHLNAPTHVCALRIVIQLFMRASSIVEK